MGGQCVQVVDGPLSGIVFAEKRQEPYMGIDIGVLSWIYVDPAVRGQGVSHRLMKAAHAWMDEQGGAGAHGLCHSSQCSRSQAVSASRLPCRRLSHVGSGGLMGVLNLELVVVPKGTDLGRCF